MVLLGNVTTLSHLSKIYVKKTFFRSIPQMQGSARSRDDLDMEQALRPRGQNTPDVIRSALDKNDSGIATIDNLFGAPDKILIPERYIPDTVTTSLIINSDFLT